MKKFILTGFLFFITLVANATVLKDFDITFGDVSTNTGRDVTVIDLLGQIDSFEAVLANFENEGDILNFLSPKPGSKWSFEDVLAYRARLDWRNQMENPHRASADSLGRFHQALSLHQHQSQRQNRYCAPWHRSYFRQSALQMLQ